MNIAIIFNDDTRCGRLFEYSPSLNWSFFRKILNILQSLH